MSTRPTSDRVREALFNILSPLILDSCFLDLFSGTGAVGIEALSRGAEKAVFVEKERHVVKIIQDNLQLCNLKNAEVINMEVDKAIKVLGKRKKIFNLIFIDPPYKKDFEMPTMEAILDQELLAPDDGVLIVESDRADLPPDQVRNLKAYRRERYGDTALTFYRFDI